MTGLPRVSRTSVPTTPLMRCATLQNSAIFTLSTQVYNTRFVDLSQSVLVSLNTSMAKLSNQGLNILNLFIPKPDIPPAIAANYREVTLGVK